MDAKAAEEEAKNKLAEKRRQAREEAERKAEEERRKNKELMYVSQNKFRTIVSFVCEGAGRIVWDNYVLIQQRTSSVDILLMWSSFHGTVNDVIFTRGM